MEIPWILAGIIGCLGAGLMVWGWIGLLASCARIANVNAESLIVKTVFGTVVIPSGEVGVPVVLHNGPPRHLILKRPGAKRGEVRRFMILVSPKESQAFAEVFAVRPVTRFSDIF